MFYQVDPNSGVAIYEQIARQIKFAVASDVLRAGEMIPSVRELAQTLAVNPNTVARAYRELQADGVIESLRGEGVCITKHARDYCRTERLEVLKNQVLAAIVDCRRGGLDHREIRALIKEVLEETAEEGTSR